jgi:protein SCO1/2
MLVTDTEVDRSNASASPGKAPPSTFRLVRESTVKPGRPAPHYAFINQFGQPISIDHPRQAGRHSLHPLSFPTLARSWPTTLPRLSRSPGDVNAPTNWQLLTISFDPDFDTPAVLKAYAKGK